VATIGHHHFHEVACYVMSGSVGSVVVAATPSGDPAHVWTQLERAVAAYPFDQHDRQSRSGIGPGHLGAVDLVQAGWNVNNLVGQHS
jgi:hypothetical protein